MHLICNYEISLKLKVASSLENLNILIPLMLFEITVSASGGFRLILLNFGTNFGSL